MRTIIICVDANLFASNSIGGEPAIPREASENGNVIARLNEVRGGANLHRERTLITFVME